MRTPRALAAACRGRLGPAPGESLRAPRALAAAPGPRAFSASASNAGASSSRLPPTLHALLAAEQQQLAAAIEVHAWARAVRNHRNMAFVELSDGSLPGAATLQAVVHGPLRDRLGAALAPGAALRLSGRLMASKGKGQTLELQVDEAHVEGATNAMEYPIPLTASSAPADLLRRNAHLRSRDSRHAAVVRARDALERGLAAYFYDEDFVRVTAPIITSSDCEGAGEVFRIVADADAADAPHEAPSTGADDTAPAAPDARPGFWSGLPAYLTVSAQLHLEALTHGLARVWTMGPSFRAEGSATNRHLAEFWMCEAEMGTSGGAGALDEVMTAAEGCIRSAMQHVLGEGAPSPRTERAQADARFLVGDEDMLEVLRTIATSAEPWERITYDEAVRRLMTRHMTAAFSVPPCWGDALASEHERWLAVGGPLFVTDYPAAGKPFYMRVNEAEQGTARQTVACFDLLVPRIGELVGGSLREERADVLQARMRELGVAEGPLRWYVHDLRRFGCAPHGGFGLGVERLLSWATETENLRDCVTFPRTKGPVRF